MNLTFSLIHTCHFARRLVTRGIVSWTGTMVGGQTVSPSDLGGANTFFHGSLGNAARINDELDWSPGSFCNTSAFRCSSWYDSTREFLLHADWRFLPANEFVDSAEDVAASLGCTDRIFVRPDSPLKPFSGRVLDVASVTLRALDHGFYFDDCLLYTSPSPRDRTRSRMPSSA